MKVRLTLLSSLLLAALPAQAIDFGDLFGGDTATADDGHYTFKSGSQSARILLVGKDKTATVTQTGGQVRIEQTTLLGYNASASGSYLLSAGLFSTQDLFVGENGAGNWVQIGGVAEVRGLLRIRDRFSLTGLGSVSAGFGTQLLSGRMQMSGGSLFSDVDQRGGAWYLDGGLLKGDVSQQGGRFEMRAGTLVGNLDMAGGSFSYWGGSLLGRVNLGSAVGGTEDQGFFVKAALTLPNGLSNQGKLGLMQFGATLNGAGLDNQGQLDLLAVLDGTGPLRNRGLMRLFLDARIQGSGGFVNEGHLVLTPAVYADRPSQALNPVLANTGPNRNTGTLDLGAASARFTLEGGALRLDNSGLIKMQGASVDGTGLLSNLAGGRLQGWGQVKSRFSNEGQLIAQGGVLNLAQGWINRGLAQVDVGAWLDGARIDNRGQLRAAGILRAEVLNTGLLQLGSATAAGNTPSKIVNNPGGVLRVGLDSEPAGGAQVLDVYLTGDIDTLDGGRIEVMAHRIAHFEGELQLRGGSVLDLRHPVAYFDGHTVFSRGVQLLGTAAKVVRRGTVSFADGTARISDPGSYSFFAGSTLRFDLFSQPSGLRASHLDVGSELFISGGRLQLTLQGSTPVRAGLHVDLIDWGRLNGRFGQIDVSGAALPDGLRWDFDRLYTNGEVWISAVPEPATWLQLLAGVGLLGFLGRRRIA